MAATRCRWTGRRSATLAPRRLIEDSDRHAQNNRSAYPCRDSGVSPAAAQPFDACSPGPAGFLPVLALAGMSTLVWTRGAGTGRHAG